MVVECPYCEARTDAKLVASHIDPPCEDSPFPHKVSFLSCPNCDQALVAGQSESFDLDADWEEPVRIWPSPDKHLSSIIPEIVRTSLEEANKCFKATAFSACAVMCGRALEGICRHYKTKSEYLAGGLKELHEKEVIDGRLITWSNALRFSRNIGAHATGDTVSKDEARDLLLFANAICEYVFVLSAQFEQFMRRRETLAKKKRAKKSQSSQLKSHQ